MQQLSERAEDALSAYDYELPASFIAQVPVEPRPASRLMRLSGAGRVCEHGHFGDLDTWLRAGDLLVFNDVRVSPVRLAVTCYPRKTLAEVFLIPSSRNAKNDIEALVRPGKCFRPGAKFVSVPKGIVGEVTGLSEIGRWVRLNISNGELWQKLEQVGAVPLPPYIENSTISADRYQTVFATVPGATAAPTAALHFDEPLLGKLRSRGIDFGFLTLFVGPGTFTPMREENLLAHQMHREFFEVPAALGRALRVARQDGRRIIPVGTTVVRALESLPESWDGEEDFRSSTELFIRAGFPFRWTDALITNFHLPKSSLLVLVSALIGRENVLAAYQTALQEQYRFFSFGDAMFIDNEC